MSNLESAIQTLLSRLEQVTNRLEGVEKQLASGGAPAAASSGGSAGSAEAEASPSVVDFDALVQEHLKHFYDASEKIGAEVAKQAAAVKNAIAEQRKLLVIAAQSKKPDDKTFQDLLQPLSKAIGEVGKVKEESRSSKFPNNLATVSEGIAALGWVAVTPTPGPHINDMRGGSEFYSNRILKEFKGKDETQVSFVTGFNGFLKELFTFVKKHHTTGLSWNPRGGDAKAAAGSAGSAAPAAPAAPKAAGGPPPPPPPAALLQSAAAAPAQSSGPDMGNVFAAINKGTDVTSGLKKVTADMKSKNRTDKSSVVPAGAVKSKTETKAAGGAVKKGPPKIALEGNKWVVENQDNNFDIVIEATEAKQTVYVYRCDNSKIVIKGKINSITLDECKKSGVVFESAIASCEVVNCKSVEVQCTGKVPSYAVDKTSGFQLYLSAEGLESEIVTSKSDSMNVIVPGEEDIIEMPIPEQYKTVVKGGKSLVTEAVQHV